MKNLTLYVSAQTSVLRARLEQYVREQSTVDKERGSHTTDVLLWAVAVIAIVAVATAAVTAYINTQVGKLQ